MKCLMIKTKDNRKFFTNEEYFSQLVEFSKLFNAELSLVKVRDVPILKLEELAPAICDPNYKNINTNYETVAVKIPLQRKERRFLLTTAEKIKTFIRTSLLEMKVVSLKDIKKEFKTNNFTTACLCNHFTKVRNELINEGYNIVKVGGGKYKIFP